MAIGIDEKPDRREARGERLRRLAEQARDVLTVERVFGSPIERDGVTVIPVASVSGAGGGGRGGPELTGGEGLGLSIRSRGLGVFVIRDGEVLWRPAVDVSRMVLVGNVVGVACLVVGWLMQRTRAKAAVKVARLQR